MKSVEFPEANCELAKDQPQYQSLHVHVETKKMAVKNDDGTIKNNDGVVEYKEVPWSMTACFQLTEDEIDEIIRTKYIWHTQMVMGNPFQPIMMSTTSPFIGEHADTFIRQE